MRLCHHSRVTLLIGRFLYWLTGSNPWHCDVHDRSWPAKIALLEEASGINPHAHTELFERIVADLRAGRDADSFADPDLTGCGSRRCRKRRGLTA